MHARGRDTTALSANPTAAGAATRHLYVHVPFCARRCSYCDFSIAVRSVTPVAQYVDALATELGMQDTSAWSLDTIYLGGGTPSRLGADGIARVLELVRSAATVSSDAEITLEANPDDITPSIATAWRAAGVTRVSLGAQSFDDAVLRWMHRTHDATQIASAVASLRAAGIDNVSLDMIFALPRSLDRDWRADLERALALEPAHVSLYGLTVEHGTPLGRWVARGDAAEAGEDSYEQEFLCAHDTLAAAGFDHYEVSNFALPGKRSRHNSSYWLGAPYAALGPSAHGFDGARRWWNVSCICRMAAPARARRGRRRR